MAMALSVNRYCRSVFQIPSLLSVPRPTSLRRGSAAVWRRALYSAPPGPLPPRVFPSTGFELLDPAVEIEEECWRYAQNKYYPAQIGEVLCGRYQIVGKLGFEAGATTWLCRDLVKHAYVTAKIYGFNSVNRREAHISRHLMSLPNSSGLGDPCISKPLRLFKVEGPWGEHICILHRPQGMNLEDWKADVGTIPTGLLRKCFRRLLLGLHYLHTEARVVHTDVQMKNVRMGGPNMMVLAQYENSEMEDPSPRKSSFLGHTIYKSRPLSSGSGSFKLTGFGEARLGDYENWEDVMPTTYKAPEVLLGMRWSYPVDIWAAALTMWDLAQDRPLFNVNGPFGSRNTNYHLARLIGLLGPAPAHFLNRHENTKAFWDEQGRWKHLNVESRLSLEECERRFGGAEKASFLGLISSMLSWAPEKRPTAKECLNHPWILNEGSNPLGWPSWWRNSPWKRLQT